MDRLTRPHIEADPTAVDFMDMEVKMEDVGDKLLELILNGPTINSVTKNILRHIVRHLYTALKQYEDTGLTPELIEEMRADAAAMTRELARVKAELDATKKDILKCCKTCAKSMVNNGTGLVCRFARECSEEYEHWEWRGAKDTNVPTKKEEKL